jgi:hypothetical protein
MLNFFRLDYPDVDPEDWHKLILVRNDAGSVATRDLPVDYYLREPYAPTFEENYHAEVIPS